MVIFHSKLLVYQRVHSPKSLLVPRLHLADHPANPNGCTTDWAPRDGLRKVPSISWWCLLFLLNTIYIYYDIIYIYILYIYCIYIYTLYRIIYIYHQQLIHMLNKPKIIPIVMINIWPILYRCCVQRPAPATARSARSPELLGTALAVGHHLGGRWSWGTELILPIPMAWLLGPQDSTHRIHVWYIC